jgi:hypothetical protein
MQSPLPIEIDASRQVVTRSERLNSRDKPLRNLTIDVSRNTAEKHCGLQNNTGRNTSKNCLDSSCHSSAGYQFAGISKPVKSPLQVRATRSQEQMGVLICFCHYSVQSEKTCL